MTIKESINNEETIKKCLLTDAENFVKNHVNFGMSILEGADFLSKEIKKGKNYKLYEVYKDKELAGMFGIEDRINIHPFFLVPKFRQQADLSDFWDLILSHVNEDFISSVYETNKPGIAFLERNNGKKLGLVPMNNSNLIVYKFTKRIE